MKIPFEISQTKQQRKIKVKSNDKHIVDGICVNKATEPTLYNVKNAALQMKLNDGIVDKRIKMSAFVDADLPRISIETLKEMNVGLSNLKEDFSLIELNNPQINFTNPNVFDLNEAINLENKPVEANKAFPDSSDPLLQVDDAPLPGTGNNSLQSAVDFIPPVDTSEILSNLNIINLSSDYFGTNKYFK